MCQHYSAVVTQFELLNIFIHHGFFLIAAAVKPVTAATEDTVVMDTKLKIIEILQVWNIIAF